MEMETQIPFGNDKQKGCGMEIQGSCGMEMETQIPFGNDKQKGCGMEMQIPQY